MDSVTRLALPAAKKKVGADDELPGHLCYLLQKKKHCFFYSVFYWYVHPSFLDLKEKYYSLYAAILHI
jgi:hypothetical protein